MNHLTHFCVGNKMTYQSVVPLQIYKVVQSSRETRCLTCCFQCEVPSAPLCTEHLALSIGSTGHGQYFACQDQCLLVFILASSSNASASVVLYIARKFSYPRNFYDWLVSTFSILFAKLIVNCCADLQGPRLEVRPILGMRNVGQG